MGRGPLLSWQTQCWSPPGWQVRRAAFGLADRSRLDSTCLPLAAAVGHEDESERDCIAAARRCVKLYLRAAAQLQARAACPVLPGGSCCARRFTLDPCWLQDVERLQHAAEGLASQAIWKPVVPDLARSAHGLFVHLAIVRAEALLRPAAGQGGPGVATEPGETESLAPLLALLLDQVWLGAQFRGRRAL
jgi:hypothetical protein